MCLIMTILPAHLHTLQHNARMQDTAQEALQAHIALTQTKHMALRAMMEIHAPIVIYAVQDHVLEPLIHAHLLHANHLLSATAQEAAL